MILQRWWERFLGAIILLTLGFMAGGMVADAKPRPGVPLPIEWLALGPPFTCWLERDGTIGFCLTDGQLHAAASPSPGPTP